MHSRTYIRTSILSAALSASTPIIKAISFWSLGNMPTRLVFGSVLNRSTKLASYMQEIVIQKCDSLVGSQRVNMKLQLP